MQIERELLRGAGAMAVLQLLSQREMYGYELVDTLARKSGSLLLIGQSTLYPLLYNLEAKGFIKSREAQAENGRFRRYYSLTDKGRVRLQSDLQQWRTLQQALAMLGIGSAPASAQEA